jgi:hypothetical protein
MGRPDCQMSGDVAGRGEHREAWRDPLMKLHHYGIMGQEGHFKRWDVESWRL